MEQDIDLESLFLTSELSMEALTTDCDMSLIDHDTKEFLDSNNNNTADEVPPSPKESPSEDSGSSTNTEQTKTLRPRRKVEYNLRRSSILNRVETEKRQKNPKEPKPKNRPPPLSKYRRRAANARERGRMMEINVAFDELSKVIPVYMDDEPKEKQTKITTLRLALNYISALRETLGYPPDSPSPGFNSSGGESCGSPSEASVSDTASEGFQSPGRLNMDLDGDITN